MHAGCREIGDVHERVLTPLLPHHVHPTVPVPWLGQGISGPVVVHMLVLAGEKAVVAVLAPLHINDHVPFLQFKPSSAFQRSIWTRQEFTARLWDFSIIILPGLS